MTDAPTIVDYGDPLTKPFWDAATEGRFVIQRCRSCGEHQFYPRPFCLGCTSDGVEWVQASGRGTIYSLTTVHRQILPTLPPPPYAVALVDLEEGPRFVASVTGGAEAARIGAPVHIAWIVRDGLPPLPVFELDD